MKLFEIKTPDGRYIRHEHENIAAARKALLPGYDVTGEVIGAHSDHYGGFVQPIGDGAKSLLAALLAHGGDEMKAWLAHQGFEPKGAKK